MMTTIAVDVMTGNWSQTIVLVLVNLLTAAFIYGGVVQKQKEHERRLNVHDDTFEKVDEEQNRQWQTIGRVKEGLVALGGKPVNGD